MTDQVQPLAPGNIERPTQQAAQPERAPLHVESSTAAAMGEHQQAALKEVDRLRGEFLKAPSNERDGMVKKIAALQKYAFGHGEKPADFMPSETPAPDMREHDPMAALDEQMRAPATQAELERIEALCRVRGLDAMQAKTVGELLRQGGFDRNAGKQLAERMAKHTAEGFGVGVELTQEDHATLGAECLRQFGSVERYQRENALARAAVEHFGLADLIDKHAGSLAYDPAAILAFAWRAKVLGLKPKAG